MKKWEYKLFYTPIEYPTKKNIFGVYGVSDVSGSLWEKKNKEGKTKFDKIEQLGKEGWELISCCPIGSGFTDSKCDLLFIFKRPLLEGVHGKDISIVEEFLEDYKNIALKESKPLKESDKIKRRKK